MVSGRLVSKLIDFGTLLVLSRLLQPADFGLVAMAMTVVLIVEAVLELPLTQALLRLKDAPPSAYDTAFTLGVLRGLFIALLLALLAYPLSLFYGERRLVGLVLSLALGPAVRGMVSPHMAKYQQALDFRWSAGLDVLGKVVALIGASTVALLTHSYWALAVAAVSTPLVVSCASFVVAPYRPRLSLAEWNHFADILGWHTLSQLANALNWQLDKLVLGRFSDALSLGRFFMAENLSTVPSTAIIGPVAHPLIAAFSALPTPEARRSAYARASAAITMVGAPLLMGMACLADPLVRLAFDAKWLEAVPLVRVLTLSTLLTLPIEPIGGLVMAMNLTRVNAWRSVANLGFRLPATLVAAHLYGVTGVVGARAAANFAFLLLGMFVVARFVGLPARAQLRVLLRPLGALAAMTALLLFLAPILHRIQTGLLLALAVTGTIVAAGVVYLGVTFITWRWAGRPHGAEAVVAERLARHRLRSETG
jgi:O-antigen/teichoic acid export membrane protein